ncbi:unnamed protein product [Mytilus coruscus]|uniref:Uncharacterized protein n=1 Tax=Mytilus coruscus TaxID=42192 RepID=A0A6J8BU63_MYTCO|nr:unnamed protein product [Mytilus coruscus]
MFIAGLWKQCFTKIRQTEADGGIKVDTKKIMIGKQITFLTGRNSTEACISFENGKYPPFRNQLNLAWDDVSKIEKRKTDETQSILQQDVFTEALIDAYLEETQSILQQDVLNEALIDVYLDETQSILQQDVLTEALIDAYLDPNCHPTWLQILSLFACIQTVLHVSLYGRLC